MSAIIHLFDLLLIAEFPKLRLSMTTPMRIMKSNIEEVTRIMVSLPFFIILSKKFSHKELHVCYITPCKIFFILIKLFIGIVKFRLLNELVDNQSMSSRFSHYFYWSMSKISLDNIFCLLKNIFDMLCNQSPTDIY